MTDKTDKTDKVHPVNVNRGAHLRSCGDMRLQVEIGKRVKATKKRKNIMSMLATGWLPWGVDWREKGRTYGVLPLCAGDPPKASGRYIMCCGHSMSWREAQDFVDAGLLMDGGKDTHGRPVLVITEAGRAWLAANW